MEQESLAYTGFSDYVVRTGVFISSRRKNRECRIDDTVLLLFFQIEEFFVHTINPAFC
jgi:hypothetical protein